MFKACAKCGKIHAANYTCTANKRIYVGGNERKLRSTNKWTEKSKEIREKANHLCEICRDKGIYTYNDLEVHHITKVKEDSTLLLDNDNLICLCQFHHKEADKGRVDIDYMRRLAKEREAR